MTGKSLLYKLFLSGSFCILVRFVIHVVHCHTGVLVILDKINIGKTSGLLMKHKKQAWAELCQAQNCFYQN